MNQITLGVAPSGPRTQALWDWGTATESRLAGHCRLQAAGTEQELSGRNSVHLPGHFQLSCLWMQCLSLSISVIPEDKGVVALESDRSPILYFLKFWFNA